MKWKDLSNHQPIELVDYIKNYLKEKPDAKLFIGTDSQNRGQFTHYAFVVVFYNEKKGGKVIYARDKFPLIEDRFTRLWKEIEYSLQIAQELNNNDIEKSLLTIHLDYATDEQYFSNKLLTSALGWATGMGYACSAKPNSVAASRCADMIVKS